MNGKTPMAGDNRKRSKLLCKILDEHYHARDNGYEQALTDLLSDARHFCDYRNLSMAEVDRVAHQHYSAEKQAS